MNFNMLLKLGNLICACKLCRFFYKIVQVLSLFTFPYLLEYIEIWPLVLLAYCLLICLLQYKLFIVNIHKMLKCF